MSFESCKFWVCLLGFSVIGVGSWSRETHLAIVNLRDVPVIQTKVTNVDPFDFEEGNGPQDKFRNVTIPAKGTVHHQLEVNILASECPFTMELIYKDGKNAKFRINQKYALGEADPDFSYSAPYTVDYERIGNANVIKVGASKLF